VTEISPAVRFADVVKTYRQGPEEIRALGGVSLDVAPGELVAVMGPSGCGKSTLLHLAGALEDPTAGRVIVDGVDVAGLSPTDQAELRRKHVGYVFQRLNLVPSLTALENVMLPLELDGIRTAEARRLATDALELVELPAPFDRPPDELSGGQQQRVAIARAVAGTRRLLLADEPTGALDTASGDRIIDLLARLCTEQGAAVVLVTHEPRFAAWADRVVFLRDGRVVDETRAVAPMHA
jgi:putative ABC transport system ATP-binding protein